MATASHNGGRYQIGLNFLQIGNDFPFLNLMKTAQSWTYVDNSGVPAPDELDANGYAKAGSAAVASHGGVYTIFYVPTQTERPGRYKITWTGNGTIYTGMAATSTTGSKTGSGGSGSFEFSTTDFRFVVGHTTGGNVSNMKVFHVDDEVDILAGNVFGNKFKERLAEGKFGVIRFMDWQPGNTTNVTTWATRKPVGYAFYSGAEYRESLWAGPTTNSGDAYTASLTPSSWTGLVDKATVIVKFNATASSDSATLNVAGTGDIAIKQFDGETITSSLRPLADRIGILVYDATLNAWLKRGGDTGNGNNGLNNGVPMELMVQLAAETGNHPYFVTPYLSIDPATDYMPSLATYIRDTGPAWMIPRFEGTNETWNSALGFPATRYGWNKANAYWGTSFDHHNWYGKIVSVLGQAISAVYSNDRSRYQLLAGVQTVTGASASSSNARLTSSQYVAQAAAAQSGYTKSAAYNWVTHICCAQYITPVRYGALQELTDGYAYVVTNAANPATQATLAASYADTLLGASAIYNLAYLNTMYVNWYGWAQNNWGGSIKLGLCGYEGGYSPDYSPTVWTAAASGVTQASSAVVKIRMTSNPRGTAIAGNAAAVGMSLSFASMKGMTQLNGNTYTVTAVSGNDVTLNVDSSAFTAVPTGAVALTLASPGIVNWTAHGFSVDEWVSFDTTGLLPTGLVAGQRYQIKTVPNADSFTVYNPQSSTTAINFTGSQSGVQTAVGSGIVTYVNSPLYTNTLRYASKFSGSLATHALNNLRNFEAAGGAYPAIFILSGPSTNADRNTAIGTGQVWGMFDPSIWATPHSPAWDGGVLFSERKRRFTVRT